MMVTEGGVGRKTEWRHIRHFSYEALRKRWQKVLLDEVTAICGNSKSMRALRNKLYQNNGEGFYVHAKTEITSAKIAAKYIGRYVGRPAIAESRILKYDGVNVTYKYTRHEDNKVVIETVHAYEFIKKLIIHIPEKNFKMVRYFGIYSRRSKGQHMREYLKSKIIEETKGKLEEALEIYSITRGITYGRINPTSR